MRRPDGDTLGSLSNDTIARPRTPLPAGEQTGTKGTKGEKGEKNRRRKVSDNIVHTTDAEWETDVLNSDKPVLVDYWAEWCGPCKMIAPILDEIASEYGEKLKVCKIDIDANQETPPKYGIRGIPTLMLFKNGDVAATKIGALSKSQLAAFIDSNL